MLGALVAVSGSACTSPDPDSGASPPEAWTVHRLTSEGPGEEIGKITLTDPTGGPARAARVGTHGIRIVLDDQIGEAGEGGEAGADVEVRAPAEVRVIYSRQGAADTRAFIAVKAPGEPGVYLGTVDLVAAGEWRLRVSIVGAGRGSARITVPGS